MGTIENYTIKNEILKIIPDVEIILFGSRAKGDSNIKSDYDILITVKNDMSQREKISLSTVISKTLAKKNIPADVIVQTCEDIERKSSIPGNIVREAINNGVTL